MIGAELAAGSIGGAGWLVSDDIGPLPELYEVVGAESIRLEPSRTSPRFRSNAIRVPKNHGQAPWEPMRQGEDEGREPDHSEGDGS